MKEKVCGVTGHRKSPLNIWSRQNKVCGEKSKKPLTDGYTYFISGFADGADQLFAGIVLEKAKENPPRCVWRQRFRTATAISG